LSSQELGNDSGLTDSALTTPSASPLQVQEGQTEYKVGDTKEIHSSAYIDGSVFTAECVAVTDHCTLWFDATPGAKSHYTKDEIAAIAPVLESHAVTTINTFGDTKRLDMDQDGRIAFIFYPFKDSYRTTGGFSTPANLYKYDPVSNLDGNEMDMLNVNAYGLSPGDGKTPFKTDEPLSICSHEWQHLINQSQTLGSQYGITGVDAQYDTRDYFWLDETFAQSSMVVNGLGNIANPLKIPNFNRYLAGNNHSLTVPFAFKGLFIPQTGDLSKGIYINWLLFGRYLSIQTQGYAGGSAMTVSKPTATTGTVYDGTPTTTAAAPSATGLSAASTSVTSTSTNARTGIGAGRQQANLMAAAALILAALGITAAVMAHQKGRR